MHALKILGIDPGTAIVGYGLIEAKGQKYEALDYGCITTPAHTPMEKRLELLYRGMNQLLSETQPDAVAVEELFFNRNITTAITVGQARGVILLSIAQKNIEFAEYTPLEVKQAVVGYGRAEKQQIQYMVTSLLKLKSVPKPDDAADALAIAICHAHYMSTKILRGEQ